MTIFSLQEEGLRKKEEDCDRGDMYVEPAKIGYIYLIWAGAETVYDILDTMEAKLRAIFGYQTANTKQIK
jgi:hypothetical protein